MVEPTYVQHYYSYHKYHIITTRQMLAALWGEPEVYRNAVVKHNDCKLTSSVQQAVNRI